MNTSVCPDITYSSLLFLLLSPCHPLPKSKPRPKSKPQPRANTKAQYNVGAFQPPFGLLGGYQPPTGIPTGFNRGGFRSLNTPGFQPPKGSLPGYNRGGFGSQNRQMTFEREKMVGGGLCGDGSPFCSSSLQYPHEMINRALNESRDNKWMRPLFDPPLNRNARPRTGAAKEQNDNIENTRPRTGAAQAGDWENVCHSTKTTMKPQVGTNTKNQQRFLVQVGRFGLDEFDDLVRTVNIVKCTAREDCSGQRNSECFQEYTENKMIAWDGRNGQLIVDNIKFPSACICKIQIAWGK